VKRCFVPCATAVAIVCACATDPESVPGLGILAQPDVVEVQAHFDPPLQIVVRTDDGDTVPVSTDVFLTLHPNSVGARLEGTTTVAAVRGIATFTDLSIDRPARDLHIRAQTPSGTVPGGTGPIRARATFLEDGISAGRNFGCAVTVWYAALCWGAATQHQLGDSSHDEHSKTPVPVRGHLRFGQVSAGDLHACGITSDGRAYCWGHNGQGQVGDGTRENQIAPVAVAVGDVRFTGISAGMTHTCAVATDASAWCWGDNGYNRLGHGDLTTFSPGRVVGDLQFAEVTVGGANTCALTIGGQAYCWGWNNQGQLGDGTTEDRGLPTPVAGGLTFLQLAADGGHTCGVAADRRAYCWGADGQLAPTLVAADLSFSSLTIGAGYVCGVAAGGIAYCWGANEEGQLGDGSQAARPAPAPVAGGLRFSAMSAGWYHTCGVTTEHAVYCWGRNDSDQLGDSTDVSSAVPVRLFQ
jgi:alpha-tubulin suppressor-like RCC1 family protein